MPLERIYHTWDKWECYPAGFYEERPPKGMTTEECEEAYRDFLADTPRFSAGLDGVTTEWVNSCEHYLTNRNMNRIAWLGQAAMCYVTGVPSRFRGGYNMLSEEEQAKADNLAHCYLKKWLIDHGETEAINWPDVQSKTKANLY